MNNMFVTSAAALDSHLRTQEAVAFNVANVNTPGFKRRVSATGNAQNSFRAAFDKAMLPSALPRARTSIDFSQGDLRSTGNPFDVALNGEGFIKVSTPDGIRYTRNGNLTIDKDGAVVMQNGDRLALKEAGGPVTPNGEEIVITKDGTIQQGQTKIGKLDIVRFDDPKRLVPENGALFRAPEDLQEAASDATVQQGSLEGANVNPVQEFISMISVQRNFESVTQLLRNIDDVVKKSLDR